MNVLALESATSACSAALLRDGAVAAERFRPMVRGHVEALMPMVQEVLAAAGVGFEDVDLVAVTVGPGSFTGLRTGLAAARGVALALGLPLVGVTTLEAVAFAARAEAAGRPVLVALETRRADLYVQRFAMSGDAPPSPETAAEALLPEAAAATAPAAPFLLAGDGAARLAAALGGRAVDIAVGTGLPHAAHVARLAAGRYRPGDRPVPPAPLYLHPPEARLPAAGGRIR
jgi:tRNA threonylcarbamoyladenosine biosynthesis protein TsaB